MSKLFFAFHIYHFSNIRQSRGYYQLSNIPYIPAPTLYIVPLVNNLGNAELYWKYTDHQLINWTIYLPNIYVLFIKEHFETLIRIKLHILWLILSGYIQIKNGSKKKWNYAQNFYLNESIRPTIHFTEAVGLTYYLCTCICIISKYIYVIGLDLRSGSFQGFPCLG